MDLRAPATGQALDRHPACETLNDMSHPASNLPWLTDAEIDDMCCGLSQNAARIRYLRDELKLPVKAKPNGRPLVPRWACDALLAGTPADTRKKSEPSVHPAQPNERALLLASSRR